MAQTLFYALAIIAFICALFLVFHRNPMISALSMVGAMISLGGLYILLQAPFLGFFQIIIYAGAVMVIVLYVIMALGHEEPGKAVGSVQTTLTYLAAGLLLWGLVRPLWSSQAGFLMPMEAPYGSIQEFGKILIEEYSVPFELASLLLVGAMVGAVVLSRRKLD